MKKRTNPAPFSPQTGVINENYAPVLLDCSGTRRIVSSFACDIKPLDVDGHTSWRKLNSHTPPQRELFLILSGEVMFALNGRIYQGRAEDMFLYDIGELHDKTQPPSTPDSIILCFQIYKDFTYAYFINIENGERTISYRMLFVDAETAVLLNRTWDGLGINKQKKSIQILSLINYMLAEIVMLKHSDPEQIATMPGGSTPLSANHVVGMVMIHIDEHRGRNCNLTEISRLSGYSAAHINRIFKANLGYTISEHANAWRVNRTRELLKTDTSMKEIASELGFSSSASFSRWKRKHNL
jgi:AraC-like DNA-binding protein/mannose-6-phosphate isomerase-like protein (cupin superfamily)